MDTEASHVAVADAKMTEAMAEKTAETTTERTAQKDAKTAYSSSMLLPDAGKRQKAWDNMDGYFRKGLFILISIFIVLAAFGLYFSVNSIIDTWVEDQYVPVVQTIYYIAVIALGIYLMNAYLLKR